MVSLNRRQRDSVFRAIADPTRREILHILRGGRQTVGEIAENFRMSRPGCLQAPAVAAHGRLNCYSQRRNRKSMWSERGPLRVIDDWLQDYETFWGETLHSLKKHMEEQQ